MPMLIEAPDPSVAVHNMSPVARAYELNARISESAEDKTNRWFVKGRMCHLPFILLPVNNDTV